MKINEIPKRKYEGYIWLSDQKEPKVLHKEPVDFSKPIPYKGKDYDFTIENHNPFIIEALLYCEEENISVTVKHTGKYHIHEIDLKKTSEGAVLETVEYLPHRLNGVSKVYFKQLWLPEPDENCNDWDVLKMKALIFTGFTNSKS